MASGSTSAPTLEDTPSGSSRALAAGARTRSANAPLEWMPISVRFGQMFSLPVRHSSHSPQDSIGLTATRRPTHSPAPSPAAITVPANSWPITSGGVRLPMWPR